MTGSRRRSIAGAAQAGRTWTEIRVLTSPDAAEAAGAMLREVAAAGVAEDQPRPGLVRLRGYAAPTRAVTKAVRSLRTRLRGLTQWGLDPAPASVTCRLVASRSWTRAWRTRARPFGAGRLIVAPTRVAVRRRPHQHVIRIDPGMAFGSGAHPSTRLCLRALVRHLRAPVVPPHVLDVGTGSGILAIAAARLGAAKVTARDIDPVAVAVARRNVRANGVAGAVRVVRGAGVGPRPRRPYDLIVANIIAGTVAELLPDVRASLASGGAFIGSGIVVDRLREVLYAAAAAGLALAAVLASGEWRAVLLRPGTFSPPRRLRVRTGVERWRPKTT